MAQTLPAFMSAHADHDWTGDAAALGEPILSITPRVVPAALLDAPGPSAPMFQTYGIQSRPWFALCGKSLLAVTPEFFDDTARRTCKVCARKVNLFLDDATLIDWERRIPQSGAHPVPS
jgi:hypothetical protein